MVATFLVLDYAHVLHGAPVYAPKLLVLLVSEMSHGRHHSVARYSLLTAASVYAIALFLQHRPGPDSDNLKRRLVRYCHSMPLGGVTAGMPAPFWSLEL